jgi:transposase
MADLRAFGTEISGNRQRNHEFNLESKGAILALLLCGKSYREVADAFSTTPSSIYRIKQRWDSERTIRNKPRSGHPEILSDAEKRYIIRAAKSDRGITYSALCDFATTDVSRQTIRRVVRKVFGRKWKAMERPKLTAAIARERLDWCRFWLPRVEGLVQVCWIELSIMIYI